MLDRGAVEAREEREVDALDGVAAGRCVGVTGGAMTRSVVSPTCVYEQSLRARERVRRA